MMRLAVFRADASSDIGSGHVMRCLTLAGTMRDLKTECVFVCRELPGHLCDLIETQGFAAIRLPGSASGSAHDPHRLQRDDADATCAAILKMPRVPDWLIADHYGLDETWERRQRAAVKSILVIDDRADRRHDCDVLLDQNLLADFETRYDRLVPDKCLRLLGPHYALLQSEYRQYKPVRVAASSRRILIYFGGADRRHLTTRAVKALLQLDATAFEVDVVIHGTSEQYDEIVRLTAGRSKFAVHRDLPSLAPLLSKAAIAIGASGATNWERLYFGIPSIIIPIADNQLPLAAELARRGFAIAITDGDLDTNTLEAWIEKAFAMRREALPATMAQVVDGRGSERVATSLCAYPGLPVTLRPAVVADEAILLVWTNDPDTRRNAFDSRPISAETHAGWFAGKLAQPSHCRIFVLQTEQGLPIGQIRFDRVDSVWTIGYSLALHIRGQGLGAKLIGLGLNELHAAVGPCSVIGLVKPTNIPSRRAFLRCGFVENPTDDHEKVEFRKRI